MSIDFTAKDCAGAGNALIGWLESQNLPPEDGIPVLLLALAGLIHQLAEERGLDSAAGARAAGRALIKALEKF